MRPAVVCAPLTVERYALRGRVGPVPVVPTGMGPERSTAAAAHLGAGGSRPVLVAGVAG